MTSKIDRPRLLDWLRGDLHGEERTAVTAWLVGCTDPRLADVLFGLERQIAIEGWLDEIGRKATEYLQVAQAFSEWAAEGLVHPLRLSDAGARVPVLGGSVDAQVQLVCEGASLRHGVTLSLGFDMVEASDVVLWGVTSRGVPVRIAYRSTAGRGRYRDVGGWQLDEADGQVAIWMFHGARGTIPEETSIVTLAEALDQGVINLVVGCWEVEPS